MALIGITCEIKENRARIAPAYLEAITRAGGIPVLLPPGIAAPMGRNNWAQALDGLLLSGGVDIDPARFGQEAHPETETDVARDLNEFALLDAFLAAGKPVLGICRGIQVINVALGGDLIQHIPDLPNRQFQHRDPETLHPATLAPDSLLAAWFPEAVGGALQTNSTHHQAIGRLAEGLEAVAWCDGLVEAIVGAPGGNSRCLGVQWHPERMGDAMTPIFEWLVAEATSPR